MADARSGAGQELKVGSYTFAQADGMTGVDLTFDTATFETTSAGLTSSENSGSVATSGSFACLETEGTAGALLGQNGARTTITWQRKDGDYVLGSSSKGANCILAVTRVFDDRGARRFEVAFTVDGDIAP